MNAEDRQFDDEADEELQNLFEGREEEGISASEYQDILRKAGKSGHELTDDMFKQHEKYCTHGKNNTRVDKRVVKVNGVDYNLCGKKLPSRVETGIKEAQKAATKSKNKDKNDRATVDQVLDPRTLIFIHKWIKNGTLTELRGCISTGKEANVYHGYRAPVEEVLIDDSTGVEREVTSDGGSVFQTHGEAHFALKIFKTSILIFKDRQRYVEGEFRFRHGMQQKHNPRQMVKQWAEKEVRNLKRIRKCGIKAPEPYLQKNNIIMMEFVGEDGLAAPRLKDARTTPEQMVNCYVECLILMRKLYYECKLVHADLSEYNILYYKEELWLIDVSQSVENEHPMALDFLRRDVVNINDYFRQKHRVNILKTRYAFDFITSNSVDNDNLKDEVDRFYGQMEKDEENMTEAELEQQKVDEKVFQQIFIPQTLAEMDVEELEEYEEKKLLLDRLTKTDIKEAEHRRASMDEMEEESEEGEEVPKKLNDEDLEGEGEEEGEEEESEEEVEEAPKPKKRKEQSKMSNYERKQKLKEEKRAKRQVKVPKHLKKMRNKK